MVTVESQHKTIRLLSIFERLMHGSIIRKKEEADRFKVTEKTIQRDIDDLKDYLHEASQNRSSTILYDRKQKGYIIIHDINKWLTNDEVLVISKVLLESRAFPKDEMNMIIDKVVMQCSPIERKHVEKILLNERYHYTPTSNKQPLFKKMWDLSIAINQKRLIELSYQKVGINEKTKRIVEPVGIIFSEFYFYLIANIHDKEYEFPAIYRLDRIKSYSIMQEHFFIPEIERFEEGNFRKKIQFMQMGELLKIQFRFWGDSLEAILDRLPNARLLRMEGEKAVIEAEVFGRGIKMWLLSQAQYVEVLKPDSFREEMKETIYEMARVYEKNL